MYKKYKSDYKKSLNGNCLNVLYWFFVIAGFISLIVFVIVLAVVSEYKIRHFIHLDDIRVEPETEFSPDF